MKTIELGKYDYYDNEKSCYVVYVNEQDTHGVELDIKIKDESSVWDCYLLDCKYISKSNSYKCRYKEYIMNKGD